MLRRFLDPDHALGTEGNFAVVEPVRYVGSGATAQAGLAGLAMKVRVVAHLETLALTRAAFLRRLRHLLGSRAPRTTQSR
jgi:hypothetical protein